MWLALPPGPAAAWLSVARNGCGPRGVPNTRVGANTRAPNSSIWARGGMALNLAGHLATRSRPRRQGQAPAYGPCAWRRAGLATGSARQALRSPQLPRVVGFRPVQKFGEPNPPCGRDAA